MKSLIQKFFGIKKEKRMVEPVVEKKHPLIGLKFSHKRLSKNPFDNSGYWNVTVMDYKDEWIKIMRQNGQYDSMSLESFASLYERNDNWDN